MSFTTSTLHRAHQAIQNGQLFEAEALITSVLAIEPHNPWAWALLADITSNPREAAQYRAKVIELARMAGSQEAGTFSPPGTYPQQSYPFEVISPPPYRPSPPYQAQPYPQQSRYPTQKKTTSCLAKFVMFMVAACFIGSMFSSLDKTNSPLQESQAQALISQNTSTQKRSTLPTEESISTKRIASATIPAFVADVILPTRVNLRKGPGTGFEVITVLTTNTKVEIEAFTIASGERWYEIKWEETSGWISASVTPVDESLASLIPESTKEFSTIPPTPTVASKPTAKPAAPVATRRVGAICRDGWRSYSTGRGTCSHHGGVDHWLYGP